MPKTRSYIFIFAAVARRWDFDNNVSHQELTSRAISIPNAESEEIAHAVALEQHKRAAAEIFPREHGWYGHSVTDGFALRDDMILSVADSIRALED